MEGGKKISEIGQFRRVIANEFNKYFLACKLNDKVQIQSGKFMPGSQVDSMFLNWCFEDEVNTISRELQNGKSSDIPIGVIENIHNYQSNSIRTL